MRCWSRALQAPNWNWTWIDPTSKTISLPDPPSKSPAASSDCTFSFSLSLFGCWENNGILMWLLQGSEFVFLVNLHISFNYLLQPWFARHFSYLNWGCWCHYRCKLLFLFQLVLFIYVSLTASSFFFFYQNEILICSFFFS